MYTAKQDSIRILFVEDLPSDVELAEFELKKNGLEFSSARVNTEADFLQMLETFRPDLVIADYAMSLFNGMRAFSLAREYAPTIPFIILTGSMNEDTAVECMKAGASNYVIKERMTRLPFAVREALERKRVLEDKAHAERALRESEERYRSLFQNTHAVMLLIDADTNEIRDANSAACTYYGYSREELLAMKMTNINTLSADEIQKVVAHIVAGEKNSFQFQHRLKNGDIRDVEVFSGSVTIGGRLFLHSIVHDITDRIRMERENRVLAERLSHYLSTSPTVTYAFSLLDGQFTWDWVSENVQEVLGYSTEEALAPQWWFSNIHPQDRAKAVSGIKELGKSDSFSQEYRFLKKNRSIVWLHDEVRILRDNRGAVSEIIGTLTDISELKATENSLTLKSAALEAAANAIVITDREGNIQWHNSAFCRLTGYSPEEVKDKNLRTLIGSGYHPSEFYTDLHATVLSGSVWHGEIRNKRKNGEQYIEEQTITPVFDESGRVSRFIAIKEDITERKRAMERIASSLREKDMLLKEIHHRIKNNMQIIVSLMNLQRTEFTDARLLSAMDAVIRRIKTIALVHEQFYGSEDITRIDFEKFIDQLTRGVVESVSENQSGIRIICELEKLVLTIEQAIPVGLIVNELFFNAIKHAFAGKKEDRLIRISAKNVNDTEVAIMIQDNGIGLPLGFSYEKATSLGMMLIKELTKQLCGSIEFKTVGGTEVQLHFRIK